jgi:plastocyanin
MGRGTRLLIVAVMASLATAVLGVAARASGGGGCGGPVTDAAGTAIVIDRSCFSPTILHAPVGEPVMWANRDAVPHVVGGANMAWGSFEQLRTGDAVTYRFSEPGVYPYVCSWHPGMVGAVVVGDAGERLVDGQLGTTSVLREADRANPTGRQGASAAAVSTGGAATPWKVLAAIALGLFALTLGAGLELRRRLERQR